MKNTFNISLSKNDLHLNFKHSIQIMQMKLGIIPFSFAVYVS